MTPAEIQKMMEALTVFMGDARHEAEQILINQYGVGAASVRNSLGMSYGFMSDPEHIFMNSVVMDNVERLTGIGQNYIYEVDHLTREALGKGWNPEKLEHMLQKANVQVASNLRNVAWDQTAKAQQLGRDLEYKRLDVKMVEIRVAPDACPVCQPHNKDIVPRHGGDRPQYHIQCACYDVPARQEKTRLLGEVERDIMNQPTRQGWHARREGLNKVQGPRQYNSMTAGQKDGMRGYQFNASDINHFERGTMTFEDIMAHDLRARSANISDAIAGAPGVGEDMTLWRQVHSASFKKKVWRSVGTEVTDPGFLSTTIDHGFVRYATGHNTFVLELHIKKGTKGLWYNGLLGQASEYKSEYEFLLDKMTSYFVKLTKVVNGVDVAVVEVVL